MSVIWWTEREREILKELYPIAQQKEILKKLKNKSWYACKKEAARLDLKRDLKNRGRPKKKPKYYIGKRQLEKLLNDTDLTIYEIAKKLRTTPDIVRRSIFKYGL